MKILVVNPLSAYVNGGAELNDYKLGKSFDDLGHSVDYARVIDPSQNYSSMPDWCRALDIEMNYTYDHASRRAGLWGKFLRSLFFFKFAFQLCRSKELHSKNYDIVLLTGRPILSLIAKKLTTPVVLSVRGEIKGRWYLRWWNYLWIKVADGVIFWGGCEQDMPDSLLSATKHICLDPAVDYDIFFPSSVNTQLRNSLCEKDSVLACFIGRLERVKQIEYIIRSIAGASNAGFKIKLIIIGDGALKNELQGISEELLPGCVEFLGKKGQSELADYYRASDLFLLYSSSENHPIALKEAVACGTYAIAANIGRVATIISDSSKGVLVPPNDQEALNNAVISTLKSSEYQKHSQNGCEPSELSLSTNGWLKNAKQVSSWAEGLTKIHSIKG